MKFLVSLKYSIVLMWLVVSSQVTGQRSLPNCEAEDQNVCMTCTIAGICHRLENGSLFPAPTKSCSPGQLCDNNNAPGLCQSRIIVQDPECLAISAQPGFTDDFLEESLLSNSVQRQNGVESMCSSDEEPICVDCNTVGRCVLLNGVFTTVSIFNCADGYVCENSLTPGLCQEIGNVPANIPCFSSTGSTEVTPTPPAAGTTQSPVTYCTEDGSLACYDCTTLGRCSVDTQGILSISPVASCTDSRVCDNSVTPGLCQDPSEIPGSACLDSSATSFCTAADQLVCFDCNSIGVCISDGSGGFTVERNAACFTDMLCDNNIMPGSCQASSDLPGSSCLSTATSTSASSTVSDTTFSPSTSDSSPTTSPTTSAPTGMCVEEGDFVCVDCLTVGFCTLNADGSLTPIGNSNCVGTDICDNTISPGVCVNSTANPNSLCLPQPPEAYCEADTDSVCFSCTEVGICSDDGTGTFTVSANSNCPGNQVCDNTLGPGFCMEAESIPESSECFSETTTTATTVPSSTPTETPVSSSPTSPTTSGAPTVGPTESPAAYCNDAPRVCFDCTTIGECFDDDIGGQSVRPTANCAGSMVCDNSVSPGLCLEPTELAESICVEPSTASFCTAVGDLVCLDCSQLGDCVDDGSGGFTVENNAGCFTDLFCDNNIMPGSCLPPEDLPGSSCVTTEAPSSSSTVSDMTPSTADTTSPATSTPATPTGTCALENDIICIDCTTIGVCKTDGDTLIPEANSGCIGEMVCDNTISPGVCIDEASNPESLCFPQPPENYCTADSDQVCLSCSMTGICNDDGTGVFTVSDNSVCPAGTICDNIYMPGICLGESDAPNSACFVEATTPPEVMTSSAPSFCAAEGDVVCLNCSTTSTCTIGGPGGLETPVGDSCADTEVCDNTINPGVCTDAASVATTTVCPVPSTLTSDVESVQVETTQARPESLCLSHGDPVCYNCTVPGKCVSQPGSGMTVVPVSLCASKLICDNNISRGICVHSEQHSTSECIQGSYDTVVFEKNAGGYKRISENGIRVPQMGDSCRFSRALGDKENCSKYLRCANGRLVNARCPGLYCFDEKSGKCYPPSSTQKEEEAQTPCPACGYRKDAESGSCGGFIKCTGIMERKACPGNFCFDDKLCSCVPPSLFQNVYGRIFSLFK